LTSYGVDLGVVPELDGASKVLFRFDDITFSNLPDHNQYSVLLVGGYHKWWVGRRTDRVYDDVDAPIASFLVFNVGGCGIYGFVSIAESKLVTESCQSLTVSNIVSTEQSPLINAAMRHDGSSWVEGGWESHKTFSEPSPCLWNDCKSTMVRVPTGTTVMELLALFPCLHRRLTSTTKSATAHAICTNARTMRMLTMSGAGINAMRRAVALALSTETRGTPLSVRFGAVQSIRLRV
jgi:hypothetical protein